MAKKTAQTQPTGNAFTGEEAKAVEAAIAQIEKNYGIFVLPYMHI